MKKMLVVLALAGGLTAAPPAVAKPSLTVAPSTVASGESFTLSGCVSTSGAGLHFSATGPGAFSQFWFYGPVTGDPPCFAFSVSTEGWEPGRYRITGYEGTAKGTRTIGQVTVKITA